MRCPFLIFCLLSLLLTTPARGQEDSMEVIVTGPCFPPPLWPKWTAPVLLAGVPAASLVVLDRAWYSQYARTGFHTFNDSREWLQVDKAGHAWSAYQGGRAAAALLLRTGTSRKTAVALGSVAGLAYLASIELLDAHSDRWGWSWADMGANAGGIFLFAGQEALWGEQKVQLKFSAHPVHYAPDVKGRARDLYGSSLPEKLLKDYNGQTYWLSVHPGLNLPAWLQVSLGYGASGMFGGFTNQGYDPQGALIFDRSDIPRRRQWYLAPDIDLSRVRVRRPWQRTALRVLSAVKVPAPALQFSGGKISFVPLMF